MQRGVLEVLAGRTAVRASDAERELATESLRGHYVHGRLSAAELEERLARAQAARTRAELTALMTDLPSDRLARGARRLYRVQRAALSAHGTAFVAVNGALAAVWEVTGQGGYWPAWVLAPTAVVLGAHAAGSRALRRGLGLDRREARRREAPYQR